jgi:hypothetical protein
VSDWGVWRNVTCSPECSYKARLERRKELRKLQCETCEEIFQAHPERCLECGEPLASLSQAHALRCPLLLSQMQAAAYRKRRYT